MSGYSSPVPSGLPPTQQQRHSLDGRPNGNGGRMQADRNGAVPMPMGGGSGMNMNMMGAGMAKSPPKNKSEWEANNTTRPTKGSSRLSKKTDTSHVPCKFYLQGQCQAGRMCPFSHDVESSTRPAPCKYFSKGHCKFGNRCMLAHVDPNGNVVNRRPFHAAPYQMNGGQQPGAFAQPPPGLLSMQAQGMELRSNGDMPADDFMNYQYAGRNGYDMTPQIDYISASPTYGSPPQNDHFATSPPHKGLSVLDAPLPSSFDSNGISLAARNGPFASSVPSKFGAPTPGSLGNTALRDLHNSAFGDRSNLNSLLATSPPSGSDEPLTFPKRPLHSERFRSSRPMMMSASVGTRAPIQSFEYSDDEEDAEREEDLLPASLRDLIPEGRSRRESRGHKEDSNPASFLAAQRRTLSSNTTPQESKVGSPSFSSSPSRFTGVFAQSRSNSNDFIGSPLRTGFSTTISSSVPRPTNDELSFGISSPPRQATMSTLTQELQRTKLDAARSQAAIPGGLPPAPSRTLSNGSTGRKTMDRAISNTSVSRERIEEEQELFDMEGFGSPPESASRPFGSEVGNSIGSRIHGRVEPSLGPIGGQRSK